MSKSTENPYNSFRGLSDEKLNRHIAIRHYGNFVLANGISPSYDFKIVPRTGFKPDVYKDPDGEIPVLIISASKEILFFLFMDLVDLVGNAIPDCFIDVILGTSHNQEIHQDMLSENIDICVLQSVLYDFEDLLVNDGCTGIAIFNSEIPIEIQFDEHKLILIYALDPGHMITAREVLAIYNVPEIPNMELITDAEHIHLSNDNFRNQFEELKQRLGAD